MSLSLNFSCSPSKKGLGNAFRYPIGMKIKGFVFDFNGLILDTENPELKSLESLYIKYGITFPVKI